MTAVTVESMLSVENAVDASLMVGEAGETGGWTLPEYLMHSTVKREISKREAVSVTRMWKEAKGLISSADLNSGIPDQSGIFPNRPGGPVPGANYPWESHRTPPSHQRGKTRLV